MMDNVKRCEEMRRDAKRIWFCCEVGEGDLVQYMVYIYIFM